MKKFQHVSAIKFDTIAALATAPAPAGVAVIRMSGRDSSRILENCFRAKIDPLLHPRHLSLGQIFDHHSGDTLDTCLAVYMPGPHSFTGEDVVEIQLHGSPILAQRVLRLLYALGANPAEPGEFSRRAFLNGKLDLTQAEAIAELISASGERAATVAGDQLTGRLSRAVEKLGEPLRNILAELEAGIDFPDEDIEPEQKSGIIKALEVATHSIDEYLKTYTYGSRLRDGFKVLLCGPPNAGKSSLLNLFLGRERAIVSDISGTTRDLIEESCSLNGYEFVFCDSAGITKTGDVVEARGIELALERLPWADLVMLIVDASSDDVEWKSVLDRIRPVARQIWLIVNKIDVHPDAIGTVYCDSRYCSRNFYISVTAGNGFEDLREALIEEVQSGLSNFAESSVIITEERHRLALDQARQGLKNCLNALKEEAPIEVVSAELRITLSALDEIVGKTYTEDILGRIFSKFCIGK
jgi:tRNA modification GTPase